MERDIARGLRAFTAADPLGRTPEADPWRAFREVGALDLALEFQFSHSFGKVSRFFLELGHRRLMGTRCPRCDTVWMPPRPICGDDGVVCDWVELSQRGTLVAAVTSTHRSDIGDEEHRTLGYVALAGASTLLLQQIRNFRDPRSLLPGLALRVAWAQAPVAHPMSSFWLEPEDPR